MERADRDVKPLADETVADGAPADGVLPTPDLPPAATPETKRRTPLFSVDETKCVECWGCVRHCPARAIRIVDGHTEIILERCVRCGLCVTECAQLAYGVRDDLPVVRSLLASGRTVVALLASEYIAALHPMTTDEIDAALLAAGFSAIETTVLGEELVATNYEDLLVRGDERTWLRSTCPVAVDWVRHYHPELTGDLAPLMPPYIVQARLIRSLYPKETALVYVSPCWARKEEIFLPEVEGEIDVAIGFDELRRLLVEVPQPVGGEEPRSVRRPRASKQLSVTDGFPRRALTERDLTTCDVAVARGLDDIDRLLTAVARKEISPSMVDMLTCEGCIDGPCVNRELSVFVKRGVDAAERRRQPPPIVDGRTFLSAMPSVDLVREFTSEAPEGRGPTKEEIEEVLVAGEFASDEQMPNCGACGYRTCVEHAVAIWKGASNWEMCFPLQRRRFARDRAALSEAAVIDTLTGLMNRRGFDRRLAEEVSRANRYEMPLSLLMLDLDNLKVINDQHGHAAGDSLLRSVGVLLSSELRTADIAARYGGDEFALILPSTTKTDAWAVAEKVRLALAHLCVYTERGLPMKTTASMGIASVNTRVWHPNDLVEAADRALYIAKRSGRNRVELASG